MTAPRLYSVLISEPVDIEPIAPGEPTPEVRDVCWEGEAVSDETAAAVAMEWAESAWLAKYGEDLPTSPMVKVWTGPPRP